jgi:hypothetical protein
MHLWREKQVSLLIRVVVVTVLGVFLALPESVRAHPEAEFAVASEHERSHRGAHDADFAVLTLQPNFTVSSAQTPLPFSFTSHSRESWLALSDPPPPRVRS